MSFNPTPAGAAVVPRPPAAPSVRLLVIHCLDVPNGRPTTVADVDRWHRERGFAGIGYHHVIYLDGSVHDGRPHAQVGAHAKGWNTGSLGIALVGRDRYTADQWGALGRLVRRLADAYQIPLRVPRFHQGEVAGVCGHRDLPLVSKVCPGFSVGDWLAQDMRPSAEQIWPTPLAERGR